MENDILIIGAGPGGYETAVEAAAKGLTVTIVEAAAPGGTCLNEGCIPTKALCRSAEVADLMKRAGEFGVSAQPGGVDIASVMSRKNEVVTRLVDGVRFLLKHKNITYVEGTARLVDSHTVEVNGERYSGKNLIIATGSETKYLPCEGLHLPGVLTSREILSLDHIPEKMVVIGGGVIGLEFASIFASFGTQITVVEYAREVLPNFDADIAKRLKVALKSRGIEILNQAAVTGVKPCDAGLSVEYEQKGKPGAVEAPVVLLAVGRAPRVSSLNLADIGVEFSPKGVATDGNMLTNIPGVYAIGDINGRCLLAHAAVAQGKVALAHIMGEECDIRLDVMPSAVFTSPEAAMVGLTEEQCKAQGIEFVAKKAMFGANGKALSMGEPAGMCKLIAAPDGRILGCHLFGAHAADLVQEIAALMNCDATVHRLAHTIHSHPTLGEVVLAAAQQF